MKGVTTGERRVNERVDGGCHPQREVGATCPRAETSIPHGSQAVAEGSEGPQASTSGRSLPRDYFPNAFSMVYMVSLRS